MPERDGVHIEWLDDLPDRWPLVAEGPDRRLLIHRGWWMQAPLAERQARCTALALGLEGPGAAIWLTGGRLPPAGGPRLRWPAEMDWDWWRWLLAQDG